jgi:CspA family cold shock protein
MTLGTVKWYNQTKGFGFIAPDDGEKDVFVHVTSLEKSGLSTILEGQRVRFLTQEGREGRQSAEEISLIGESLSVSRIIPDQAPRISVSRIIPDQAPLVNFGVNSEGFVDFAIFDISQNDLSIILPMREEIIVCIDFLAETYRTSSNTPQAGLFQVLLEKYLFEIRKSPEDINFVVLFARGSRLIAAVKAGQREIELGEWPEPSATEAEALSSVCDLHSTLIMASGVGRKLVTDTREYQLTSAKKKEQDKTVAEFGDKLSKSDGILAPEAAEALSDLTHEILNDLHPERSRTLAYLVTGSALSTVVGAVAWLSVGGTSTIAMVPVVGGAALGAFLWEVVKKLDRFKSSTDDIASKVNNLLDKAEVQSADKQENLLNNIKGFFDSNRPLLYRLADLFPEYSWIKKFLDR